MSAKGKARPQGTNNDANNDAKRSSTESLSIPAEPMKLVQTVKEIVNFPEAEIYAMLKDCNMNPDDTVNRLLAQDTFHEVTRKRDKKKETKDSTDTGSHDATNTSNYGDNDDTYLMHDGFNQFSSNDSSILSSKYACKKENETLGYGDSSFYASGTGTEANHEHQQLSSHRNSLVEDNKLYVNRSKFNADRSHEQIMPQLDDAFIVNDDPVEPLDTRARAAFSSNRSMQKHNSGVTSLYDDSMSSYQAPRRVFEADEHEDNSSSVAVNMQHPSQNRRTQAVENTAYVIIPDHLKAYAHDCTHLRFGSFRSGTESAISGPLSSGSKKNNLETIELADAPSMRQLDARSYRREEHASINASNFDAPSVSRQGMLMRVTTKASDNSQYGVPLSAPKHNYESTQQFNSTFAHPQTSSQTQNLELPPLDWQGIDALDPTARIEASFITGPQALEMLDEAIHFMHQDEQTERKPDLSGSMFPVREPSSATMYRNSTSSINGPSGSVSEALRHRGISPNQQHGANISIEPTFPHHLSMHPYYQPTLPLTHNANTTDRPLMPQNYPYRPLTFQQAYGANNTYNQSLLQQYNNSISASKLPETPLTAAASSSIYGFGSSTSDDSGNFRLNQPTASARSALPYYDDIFSLQNGDRNHLISQQQNENSDMMAHGYDLQRMPTIPRSTYNSYQEQQNQQQSNVVGQGQQSLQHCWGLNRLAHLDLRKAQTGTSLAQQQDLNFYGDGSNNGFQSQTSNQTQWLRQNTGTLFEPQRRDNGAGSQSRFF